MNNNDLLIINDFAGYGRVSTQAMIPILSSYGIHSYALPTALVSNTLEYGEFEILDTTNFMKSTADIWNRLGLNFSNISVGLINSDEQVEIISELIERQDSPFVLIDPIMADYGLLYDGVYAGIVEANRRLAAKADVFIPNFTEATLLAGMYEDRKTLNREEYKRLAQAQLNLGIKELVITGCRSDQGSFFNLVCNRNGDISEVAFEHCDTTFIGTGDIFSAVLMAELMNGADLKAAVERASTFITTIIRANHDNPDHYDIRFEGLLHLLKM